MRAKFSGPLRPAAAGNDDVGLGDVDLAAAGVDELLDHRTDGEGEAVEGDHLGRTAGFFGGEDVGPQADDLGLGAGGIDGGERLARVDRAAGHELIAVLVEGDDIGEGADPEHGRHPGREIAAHGGAGEEDRVGRGRLDGLGHGFAVAFGGVEGEIRDRRRQRPWPRRTRRARRPRHRSPNRPGPRRHRRRPAGGLPKWPAARPDE